MKNLDTTLADLVSKSAERQLAIANAKQYRKQVRFDKIKKNVLHTFEALMIIILLCIGSNVEFSTVLAANGDSKAETVYIICDVTETELNEDGSATLTVEMQTGDLHKYTVDEVDFEVDEVCFKTEYIDYFSTYKIVALR